MLEKVERFLAKNAISPSDIMYITRENRQTVVTLSSGKREISYIPIKYIYEDLPVGAFLNITKGVVIGRKHIRSIDGGVYTMTDGTQFRGRVRTPGAHSYNGRIHSAGIRAGMLHDTHSLHSHFSILDNCPIPFCAVELVHDSTGRIIDYIFRYVNLAFAEFEQREIDQLADRSFYDVFSDRDSRWANYKEKVVDRGGFLEALDYDDEGVLRMKTINYEIRPGLVGCAVMSLGSKKDRK